MDQSFKETLAPQLAKALEEFQAQAGLAKGKLMVVGTSTSEVIGKHIGSAGSDDVAAELWSVLSDFSEKAGFELAFQCCEHLNRAIVIEQKTAEKRGLDPVTVVPAPKAGGSMAAFVFDKMVSPVVVEDIQADAGIDIGDTFIGMHLKKVAVPVRTSVTQIGDAHLTLARTRPKLIGGVRAVYEHDK